MRSRDVLAGLSILIVEDDFLIAEDLAESLKEAGANVIGPAAEIKAALTLIEQNESLDGALLDVNLGGRQVFAVADALLAREIHFAFATGYDRGSIPPKYSHIPHCEKPVDIETCAKALFAKRRSNE